jgi:hypothetical protein
MIEIPFTEYRKSFVEPIPAWGREASGTVFIRCACGKCIDLRKHTIAADGTVSPSVWHDSPECDWHVWAKLKDWQSGYSDYSR